MSHSVFADSRFWLMVLVSVVLPSGSCAVPLAERAASRSVVLLPGIALVAVAVLDPCVLRSLAAASRRTTALADAAVFASGVSLALHLLPAMLGGVGVNLISHIPFSHPVEAQKRFNQERPDVG
jgi:hypothetical protein